MILGVLMVLWWLEEVKRSLMDAFSWYLIGFGDNMSSFLLIFIWMLRLDF